MLRVLMFILPIALTIYAFIDCLNTPEEETKHLPKVAWVFIILLFWIVGPVVWLAAGKNRTSPTGGRTSSEWQRRRRTTWVAPDDNPDFLKSLRDETVREEPAREEETERREDGPEDTTPPDRT